MGTPGNIPNPEVKHISADGTWLATARESRSLPRDYSFVHLNCPILNFIKKTASKTGVFVAHKGKDILCLLPRNKPHADYYNLHVAYFREITL